jgi:hypothetical protein
MMKRVKVPLLLAFLNFLLPLPVLAAQVTLEWDAVADSRVQGYKVRYRPDGGNHTTVRVGKETTYTLPGLKDDTLYRVSVNAYGTAAESPFCDEVEYRTPPDPRTCQHSLSSKSASYASSGGAGNVTVSAPAGCKWSSSTPPSWLQLSSGATGTGNGTVVYSLSPNTDANSRTADLTIAGQAFSVTQAGLPQHTITASAATGGLISPSGVITAVEGGSHSFAIASNPGYYIAGVTVDGQSIGAVASYTFSNVRTNHLISATFALKTYTISASATTGGMIAPDSMTITHGGTAAFSMVRFPGYKVEDVKVDGVSVGAVPYYIFSNVDADHTISVSFR